MPGELRVDPRPVAFRTLLDLLWQDAEGAMILIGPDHRLLRANPAAGVALARLGISLGDVLREVAVEVRDTDGNPVPLEARPMERALRGETVLREVMNIRYEGAPEPRRTVLSAHPIELDDGTCGALGIWHDVTDTWLFAEQRRTELARMGQLLEGASDYAIIMMDADGRVQSWSTAAEHMQGYTCDEAVGLPYAVFFDEGDRASGLPKKILTRAAGRGKVQVEGTRVRKDGSVFWAHASLTAIRDVDGRLRGFVKVTHDVSEQRASEQATVELKDALERRVAERTVQLEQQAADLAAVNAELEAFSYSVSHDLRAPLRAMNGFARIMEDELGDRLPPEATAYLEKVKENARQMGSLIDALLSFSRMQRQSMRSAPIDMTRLVGECWAALAATRGERHIDFVLPRLPNGMGDRRLIQQVWMNLLDNAIKYTQLQERPRVEVAAEIQIGGHALDGVPTARWIGEWADAGELDDFVFYTVKDNGAGFDMRYAAKLGQVFQRLHHHEDFVGTGIGLALVQRIVQRHGGRLSAVGTLGKGAVFGFTLRASG
jgi:PAS domain S-box-containing protein